MVEKFSRQDRDDLGHLLKLSYETRQTMCRVIASDLGDRQQAIHQDIAHLKQQGWDARDDPVQVARIEERIYERQMLKDTYDQINRRMIHLFLDLKPEDLEQH
jgi:hypothetical protein